MSLRALLLAAVLLVSAALGFSSIAAAEPPAGSKNFSPPPAVPNYFSNESGPVTRSPAPLPVAPPAQAGTAPAEEEAPSAVAAAPVPRPAVTTPGRRIITIVTSRTRGRVAHATRRVSDRRKVASARGRSSTAVRVVARSDRPRAARLAHAEPHAARSRSVVAKGQRAGRG